MPLLIFLTICLAVFLVGTLCLRKTFYRFEVGTKHRIVQLSDLHARRFGVKQARLLRHIRPLNPDSIVITGDMLRKHHPQKYGAALELIDGLTHICPVYVVRGNHEAECRSDDFIQAVASLGARVLIDEATDIAPNVELCGLDDRTLPNMRRPRHIVLPDSVYSLCNKDKYTVLLAHRPELIEQYAEMGAQLVLSGHAHGGMIRLPWRVGLYSPDEGFFPKYTCGLYEHRSCRMVINGGLSRIRLFNRPEISIIDLE